MVNSLTSPCFRTECLSVGSDPRGRTVHLDTYMEFADLYGYAIEGNVMGIWRYYNHLQNQRFTSHLSIYPVGFSLHSPHVQYIIRCL